MTVYAIAQSQTTDQKALDAYVALAVPTLEAHNVKVLALDDSPTNIEGAIEHARTVILEFSDTTRLLLDGPQYYCEPNAAIDNGGCSIDSKKC